MTRLEADWLNTPASRAVTDMLEGAGYAALYVGGCVRNALLGAPVSDLDIATDARPDTVMALAEAAGLKAIPTGVDHGTITVVSDGQPFEITTFRADIDTDGRHATVRFSDDVAEDAARRDFTMNALYADPRGTLIDPLGGLPDLQKRKVRFVGDPRQRIAEDHLRNLRFFRFHAWYGAPDGGMDPEALDAIARAVDGLARLSRERITQELLKLLASPDPTPSVATMAQTGVLAAILPGSSPDALGPLVHLEAQQSIVPDPIRRLAALGGESWRDLRLSRAEQRLMTVMRDGVASVQPAPELGYRLGTQTALDVLLLRSALLQHPLDSQARNQVEQGAQASFPVAAADLPHLQGKALGDALRRLESDWIAEGFTPTKADLIARA